LSANSSPPGRRQGRRLDVPVANQRRKQIVEAARACIAEEGVEKLTLRKVADKAGLSHAAIAYYFHSRQELVDAAFLQISEDFMRELRALELDYGPGDLEYLVETFMGGPNDRARFVVQMIEAGLRDMQLRATHDEFVAYGRDRIERSIRAGVECGHFRADIDPRAAAALVHTVLIWWATELTAGAARREEALAVGRLMLRLLETPDPGQGSSANGRRSRGGRPSEGAGITAPAAASPPAAIATALAADPALTPMAAATLTSAFTSLYRLAAGSPDCEEAR
jgi:AcrR family transcriptional regulator